MQYITLRVHWMGFPSFVLKEQTVALFDTLVTYTNLAVASS